MPPHETFHVVGIRPDGTRVVLTARIAREDAEYVQKALSGTVAFRELQVEPDQPDDDHPE